MNMQTTFFSFVLLIGVAWSLGGNLGSFGQCEISTLKQHTAIENLVRFHVWCTERQLKVMGEQSKVIEGMRCSEAGLQNHAEGEGWRCNRAVSMAWS